MLFPVTYPCDDIKKANFLLDNLSSEHNNVDRLFLKLSLNTIYTTPQRDLIEKLYKKYKKYCDYSFSKRFLNKGHTLPYIGELVSFHLLEDKGFLFEVKTKKNDFPDIKTSKGDLFEVTTININHDSYWGDVDENGLRNRGGNISELDNENILRITSKIEAKNKDFINKNCSVNLILFLSSEFLSPDRLLDKTIYGNYDYVFNVGTKEMNLKNFKPFFTKAGKRITPLITNPEITSNIESILFIGEDPFYVLNKIADGDDKGFYELDWKNPYFNKKDSN